MTVDQKEVTFCLSKLYRSLWDWELKLPVFQACEMYLWRACAGKTTVLLVSGCC